MTDVRRFTAEAKNHPAPNWPTVYITDHGACRTQSVSSWPTLKQAEALAAQINGAPDPDAPHPHAWRNPNDPEGVWRLGGEFVRTLGDGWTYGYVEGGWPGRTNKCAARHYVYLVRRVAPPEPRTVTVELPEDVARRLTERAEAEGWMDLDVIEGAVRSALAEDGDR